MNYFELKIRISPQNELISKTNLVCLPEAQVGWIHGGKNAKKSCDTANLNKKQLFMQKAMFITGMLFYFWWKLILDPRFVKQISVLELEH